MQTQEETLEKQNVKNEKAEHRIGDNRKTQHQTGGDGNTQQKQNNIKKQKTADKRKASKNKKVASAVFFLKPIIGGVTSSGFGDKVSRTSSHKGHDWAISSGTKVMAAGKGTVERAYYSTSYGYNILIRHAQGYETRYAHMSKLYVTEGEQVSRKQVLGLSGTTGQSTGPHLHFEVIRNGVFVDPLKYIREEY